VYRMNTPRTKRAIVYVTALIVLTLGFYDNTWKVADSDRFERFADQTESFIIGRLAKSRQDGIFSEGGLIGREVILPEGENKFSYQYEIYYNDIPFQQYRPYKSNPAIQGMIFSVLDRYLNFDAQTNVKFFRLITAIISASILSVFLLWVLDIFGIFPSLMSLLLIMLSPWLTVAGGHLYWIFGIIYLPFLIPLVLLHREYKGKKLSFRVWLIGIALAILLKCLFTGYEFITTTLVMMTIPVFFYALWQQWKPRFFIQRFLTASFSGVIGAIACAVILSIQIAQVEGSMQNGWAHIQAKLLFRTYPEETNIQRELPQRIIDSNNVPMTTVIKTYLGGSALSLPTGDEHYNLSFGSLLLIFVVISAIVFITAKNAALVVLTKTTWISIMAPLSWFIIFKSHSVLHPFLDYLVWYMPMLLIMFTSIFSLKDYSDKNIHE
jgi:hypothetical protein